MRRHLPRLRRCRPHRPFGEVTRFDPDQECDPREVGLDPEVPELLWGHVEDLYASGMHPGVAFCLRRHGKIVLNRTIGHARGNGPGEGPGVDKVVLTPQTPICIMSATKAVTAMLVHLLDDRGLLHIDDRVVDYIPEFGQQGKEWITLRHVLTHRAGIPTLPPEHNDPHLLTDWDRIIQLLCEAEPVSRAGRRLAYHAITGGFVLAEVIQRVTGRSVRQVLADEILDPLGFQTFNYGVPPERVGDVALNYFTGPRAPWPISLVPQKALGMSFEQAAELSNSHDFLTGIVPSANILGTAEEASRFFQLLLQEGELDGIHVFDRRTIHRAVQETSYLEVDFSVVMPLRYGVGLMLGGGPVSVYGPDTPRAFGHMGFINIIVWADPERQVSGALLTTGKPFLSWHLLPLLQLMGAISSRCGKTARR